MARNGHTIWGLPPSSTTATYWRDWFCKVDNRRVVTRPVVNWKRRLEVTEGTCRDFIPRGHCGLTIKAGFNRLGYKHGGICGEWIRSKGLSQRATRGRQSVIGRRRVGIIHGGGNSGAVDAASSSLPNGRRPAASFPSPVRVELWRGCVAELLTDTDSYINLRRKQTKEVYVDGWMRQIARSGSAPVRASGGMVEE